MMNDHQIKMMNDLSVSCCVPIHTSICLHCSPLRPIIENYRTNWIQIVNYKSSIQARCWWGMQNKNEQCLLEYKKTKGMIIYHSTMIQNNYYPCTICHHPNHHNQISDPYFWQEEKEKLYLDYKNGDDLLNGPKFVTLIPWHYNADNPRWYKYSRMHISHSFLISMQQSFAAQS